MNWCKYVGSNPDCQGEHVYFDREDGKVDLWVRKVKHVVERSEIEPIAQRSKMIPIKNRFTGETIREVPEYNKDFSGMNLECADFENYSGSLEGANFAEANLRYASFWDRTLTKANFNGARLTGATFRCAYLSHATFVGARLQDTSFEMARYLPFIVGPVRSDGYLFIADQENGEIRIKAGCRNFSVEEARSHWARRPESLAIVESLIATARAKGWLEPVAV